MIVIAVTLILAAVCPSRGDESGNHFLTTGGLARAIGKKNTVIHRSRYGIFAVVLAWLSVRTDGLLVCGKPPRSLRNCASKCAGLLRLAGSRQRNSPINSASGTAGGRVRRRRRSAVGEHSAIRPELQPQADLPSPLKTGDSRNRISRTDIFWGETPRRSISPKRRHVFARSLNAPAPAAPFLTGFRHGKFDSGILMARPD